CARSDVFTGLLLDYW
nr:immunoglobulin heavy chain junction region [Macaca mulatta]MOV49122.1 immunoglobulin heavy chain junction region [Macaca mulatta]MOV49685.1 immunoglobulin heavy chain junction region [Macaca mulatta]MOV50899.1 immunoglobulin heavy chain junction region [Macaca mulatta]MOV51106.1 immunoglobulin heavy chain junction region [Macaca mulatta]